jgi:putative membrane protein
MNDARSFFSADERKPIEAAIAETESAAGIEVVCAVASESGRYDRAESLVGLCGALAALGVLHILFVFGLGEGSWSNEHAGLVWQSAAVVAGFVVGSIAASYIHTLRKLFTSQSEMQREADAAAARVFMQRCRTPKRPNGALLLYVSLYEHRLVVLADGSASAAAGEAITRDLRDVAERELRANHRADAFLKVLELLRQRLPASTPAADALPNTLVIIHPRP